MTKLEKFLAGGFGATAPTLLKLAAIVAASKALNLDELSGPMIGGLILFVIGAVVAYGFTENGKKFKDFFITGMAAPSIVLSLTTGLQNGEQARNQAALDASTAQAVPRYEFSLFSKAYAAEETQQVNRSVVFVVSPVGLSSYDEAETIVRIEDKGGSGYVGGFKINESKINTLSIPADVTDLRIVAHNAIADVSISSSQISIVEVELKATGVRNLLWLFGGKKEAAFAVSASVENSFEMPSVVGQDIQGFWMLDRWDERTTRSARNIAPDNIYGYLYVDAQSMGTLTLYVQKIGKVMQSVQIHTTDAGLRLEGSVNSPNVDWESDSLALSFEGDRNLLGRGDLSTNGVRVFAVFTKVF